MPSTQLQPVRKTDVVVGRPLPWSVYDNRRKLLLCAGYVVESAHQVEQLIQAGLFRADDEPAASAPDFCDLETHAVARAPALATHNAMKTPFIESRLPVGTVIQLNADSGARETVLLIGYLERQSLIITHPTREGQIMFVKEGSSYHCRAFAGKNAYSFDSSVLRVAMAPFPHIHLFYPGTVFTSVIRKTVRVDTEIVATTEAIGKGRPITCTIKDLSLTGAQVQSKAPPGEIGEPVRIAFRLTLDEMPVLFEIIATVKSKVNAIDRGKAVVRTGLQFIDLDVAVRRELELFIYRQIVSEN